tara:strand:- start:304 stop:630 length:327 start_codon:yes stop_codon:yes gene_type:complete
MDIFNNLLDVYNSSSKNIKKKYEEKKKDITSGIGNLNTTTFYSIIAIIIILSIILPLIFLYFFNQPIVHNIFSPDTTESTLLDISSETIKDNNEIIKKTVETINTLSK